MALFGNSATIAEIHREIGIINDYLRKMETNVNNNRGIHSSNVETIASYFNEIVGHQVKAQSLMDKLSDRELRNLTLCWMDGRYLPLYMWNSSYQLVMNQVKNGLIKF